MLEILKKRLRGPDCSRGFILDGFPRNLRQAEMLDSITNIDKIIEIHISDEEAVRRLSGRRTCEKCGTGWNLVTIPPKNPEKCDKCEGRLIQREDDKEDAIRTRLGIYHSETEPILTKYGSVMINGEQSVEKVFADILQALRK